MNTRKVGHTTGAGIPTAHLRSNTGITLTLFRLPSTTLCMAFVVEGTCCLGSWRRAEIQGSRSSFATRTCVESSSGFDLAVVARSLGLLRQHLKKKKKKLYIKMIFLESI